MHIFLQDGLGGFCNRFQNVCMGIALWNHKDPVRAVCSKFYYPGCHDVLATKILKERLFGLTGPEGNHGEDCKEFYVYCDATPTQSYAKMLYKYPMDEYVFACVLVYVCVFVCV